MWNKIAQHLEGPAALGSVTPDRQEAVFAGGDFVEANNLLFGDEILGPGRSIEGYVDWYVDHKTRPEHVPLEHLRSMRYHPMVYLAEQAATGIARFPSLYHVQAKRDQDRAEVEEWLWPLLPQLLPQIVRAYIYGSAILTYDWETKPLSFEYRRKAKDGDGQEKTEASRKTINRYTRIVATQDVWLCDGTLKRDGGSRKFSGVQIGNRVYPPGRSQLCVWDREFGEFLGNGARRRAFPDYLKSKIYETFQDRYTERSVDPPRVIKAPPGTTVDSKGNQVPISKLVAAIFASIRSGGVGTIPSVYDANGNALYDISVLDLPDRSEVYNRALTRFDGRILTAYLVPPGMTGVEDVLSGGASRVVESLFGSFVEGLLEFTAGELNQVVEWVWEVNHERGTPPEVQPNQLPDRVQKVYLEVLKHAADAASLGKRVDVNALINRLNVPLRDDAEAADSMDAGEQAPARPPGRPRDATGDRERRREDSPTPEGQDDTGAPREDA